MKNQINPKLQEYIKTKILPLYLSFDSAHQPDHAKTVIDESMRLAQHYDVNPDMVYAIAAFHDTGLTEGRSTHHLASGTIIRKDTFLKEIFSPEDIETIAQAAEDHRASIDHEPRSIYGMIVAEADRCIDASTIVRRTIQYGLSHYPENDKEGHYERFLEHMKEKYAEGGYLKIWLKESINAKKLNEFQQILKNKDKTRKMFEEQWNSLT